MHVIPTKRFNSRAREGRDVFSRKVLSHLRLFQLTRPRGARLNEGDAACHEFKFQLTRPRGARLTVARSESRLSSFNSRAREGRDSRWRVPSRDCRVSTHAPARGATFSRKVLSHLRLFQLTRPRGARPSGSSVQSQSRLVSTHAPARGATGRTRRRAASTPCFNSRAREGRDPHGVSLVRQGDCFNSRAREGRDGREDKRGVVLVVSTHAPARGATGAAFAAVRLVSFQLTRPRGARRSRSPSTA